MKRLSRLTALLLAFIMLCTMFASAESGASSGGVAVEDWTLSDYQRAVELAAEDATGDMEDLWGLVGECGDDNIYCVYARELIALGSAQERYDRMMELYSEEEDNVDLDFTMLHYFGIAEHNETGVLCTCNYPAYEPEYVPGDISKHDTACLWHFAHLTAEEQVVIYYGLKAENKKNYFKFLPVEEQYLFIKDMEAEEQAEYTKVLTPAQYDALMAYMEAMAGSEACDGTACDANSGATYSYAAFMQETTVMGRYNYLANLYDQALAEEGTGTDLEAFICHLVDYHADALELICSCSNVDPSRVGGYPAPGADHAEDCPWHDVEEEPEEPESLADAYAAYQQMTDEEKQAYLESLTPEMRDKLLRVNATDYTAAASNSSSVTIEVPEGAFGENYLLNAVEAEVTAEIQSALDMWLEDVGGEYLDVAASFDISFASLTSDVGMDPNSDSPVVLDFSIPTSIVSTADDSILVALHIIRNDDGSFDVEPVRTYAVINEVASQEVKFKADSFSIYIVANTSTTSGTRVSSWKSIDVGETITLYSDEERDHSYTRWSYTSNDAFDVVSNGRYVTVTANEAGSITLNFQTRSSTSRSWTTRESITVAAGPIKVYVYVGTNAGTDANGEPISWADNEEFLELLGIGANTVDANNFFPVGEIYLDSSYLDGKTAANTVGAALINSTQDWETLFAALSEMDTSTLTGKYAANVGNKVPEYMDQVARDINAGIGSQRTALFRWNMSTSYGFADQSVEFHLDLRFSTNKITFITGNNNIASGQAKDGTVVDTRVYITGSEILPPRNLYIPNGYQLMGYYEDADFTIPWNGIGTPLNEDETVYIKITEKSNVVLHYVIAEGKGLLSLDNEALNPDTGVAEGSTATSAENYKFVGWYADEECTQLLSTNQMFIPTKPNSGWVEATYYAKFELDVADLTIRKTVTANTVDGTSAPETDSFAFAVTLNDGNAHSYTVYNANGTATSTTGTITGSGTINLMNGQYAVVEDVTIGSNYTVTENLTTEQELYYDLTSKTGDSGQIAANGSEAVFTNTYSTGSLTITKEVWDSTFTDGTKTFTFAVDGPVKKTVEVKVTGTSALTDTKSETISDLPVGSYTVTETVPSGYTASGNGATVAVAAGQEKSVTVRNTATGTIAEIPVTKTWIDFDNSWGLRPGSVIINLVGTKPDGTTFNHGKDSLTLNSNGGWAGKWTDVPQYDGEGNLITYSITENAVANYSASINGFAVTNTLETGSLQITKNDLQNGESAIFEVTVTPTGGTKKTYMVALNSEDNDTILTNLPAGASYTVVEKNWSWSYTQSSKSGDVGTIPENGTAQATFSNTKTEQWLYDESSKPNVFTTTKTEN